MIALANILGLLGLLGIIALIIIYIIKPNFQQKFVSSTFVWKLSLKYKKRRIPINKLRNLLLILCQILILTACALILSKPVLRAQQAPEFTEKIVIIDASVGMKSEYNGTTRFQRAVKQVKELVNEVLEDEEGKVSIIVASDEAYMLEMSYMDLNGNVQPMDIMRLNSDYLDVINESLDFIYEDLRLGIDNYCTYGSADIEGAMILAEDVLAINPNCEVLFYTGTEYTDNGIVTVVDVKEEGERNAAILGGTAKINENYVYTFAVDVAVYGQDVSGVEVKFTVYGANATLDNPSGVDLDPHIMYVDCFSDQVQTVEFDTWTAFNEENEDAEYGAAEGTVYNYHSVFVEINAGTASTFVDVLPYDDSFFFYGGNTETITVQYASTEPNIFVNAMLGTWQTEFSSRWNIVYNEVEQGKEYETEGYDIYIFEHKMPETLPDDGVVILIDPDSFSALLGLSAVTKIEIEGDETNKAWNSRINLGVSNSKHPLMTHLYDEEIGVTYAKPFNIDGAGWDSLMTITYEDSNLQQNVTYPVMAVSNDATTKVFVLSITFAMSNLGMNPEFPLFAMDLFNYFYPTTMTDFLYEIGETATFNSFSNMMYCATPDANATYESFTEFPASLFLDQVGTYTLTQTMMSGREVVTEFYVKTPSNESNVLRVEDELDQPYVYNEAENQDIDLLIWFAAALVALLFVEWWLQSRDQF